MHQIKASCLTFLATTTIYGEKEMSTPTLMVQFDWLDEDAFFYKHMSFLKRQISRD